ncbi:MAG: FkbM family methyltransferase [Bryobacteraceae bacterium]|nr:FkbM family methyltransferase [Bryobacteraceae bacterium]MDW8376689.1 FkbM family methyltransferase [Bryobacterales bacterium]
MKKILLLVVVGSLFALYHYAPARLSAWYLLGRNQNCPFSNAIRAASDVKEQIAKKDEILAASKLIEKDPKGFQLWETPDGRYWLPDGSEYVLPFNLAEQARNIYGWNGRGVKPGDVVLDCGANVGVYTRACLKAGAKLVVAIEPAPENLECLRRNFAQEVQQGRVIIYPKGVWDQEDFLVLHVDPHNSAADSFVIQREDWKAVERVPLTTIDRLVEELKLERVDFIKMDIEGAEVRALRGAKNTIAKFHPRMALSTYHQPDHPVEVPRVAKDAFPGYRVECGPCAESGYGVRPDILYFFP